MSLTNEQIHVGSKVKLALCEGWMEVTSVYRESETYESLIIAVDVEDQGLIHTAVCAEDIVAINNE